MTGSRRDIDGSPFNSRMPRVLSGCHETHLPLEIERILRFDIYFMLEQVTKQGLLEKVTSFGQYSTSSFVAAWIAYDSHYYTRWFCAHKSSSHLLTPQIYRVQLKSPKQVCTQRGSCNTPSSISLNSSPPTAASTAAATFSSRLLLLLLGNYSLAVNFDICIHQKSVQVQRFRKQPGPHRTAANTQSGI